MTSDDDIVFVSYPDGMRPVRLPGSADTARVVARQVAAMLEADLEARALTVASAREDWAGEHRDEFDLTWASVEGALVALIEELRGLAGAIAGAYEDAAAENEARAALREEFDAQHAGEGAPAAGGLGRGG